MARRPAQPWTTFVRLLRRVGPPLLLLALVGGLVWIVVALASRLL
jgi:hypothetical protein